MYNLCSPLFCRVLSVPSPDQLVVAPQRVYSNPVTYRIGVRQRALLFLTGRSARRVNAGMPSSSAVYFMRFSLVASTKQSGARAGPESPDPQEAVTSHGHVGPELLHMRRSFSRKSPLPFDGRGDKHPLPRLLQLVPVLVKVVVHLALAW